MSDREVLREGPWYAVDDPAPAEAGPEPRWHVWNKYGDVVENSIYVRSKREVRLLITLLQTVAKRLPEDE